jgi:hypothetical protein
VVAPELVKEEGVSYEAEGRVAQLARGSVESGHTSGEGHVEVSGSSVRSSIGRGSGTLIPSKPVSPEIEVRGVPRVTGVCRVGREDGCTSLLVLSMLAMSGFTAQHTRFVVTQQCTHLRMYGSAAKNLLMRPTSHQTAHPPRPPNTDRPSLLHTTYKCLPLTDICLVLMLLILSRWLRTSPWSHWHSASLMTAAHPGTCLTTMLATQQQQQQQKQQLGWQPAPHLVMMQPLQLQKVWQQAALQLAGLLPPRWGRRAARRAAPGGLRGVVTCLECVVCVCNMLAYVYVLQHIQLTACTGSERQHTFPLP